jgi:prephenate dehydrogenase
VDSPNKHWQSRARRHCSVDLCGLAVNIRFLLAPNAWLAAGPINRYDSIITRQQFRSFGVVGYGHFGQFMARSFSRHGQVFVTDIDPAKLPKRANGIRARSLDEVASCDAVIVAVPFVALEDALKGIRDLLPSSSVVMDVVSTKARSTALLKDILEGHPNLLATHPLFGPPSMKRMQADQRLVVTHSRGEKAAAFTRFLKRTFKLRVLELSSEEHDRVMAYMQALPFFIARALMDLDILDLPHKDVLSLPSFERLASIAAIEQHHSEDMFDTSQRSNPFASSARAQFIDVLVKIDAELGSGQFSDQIQVRADPDALTADQPFPELLADPRLNSSR